MESKMMNLKNENKVFVISEGKAIFHTQTQAQDKCLRLTQPRVGTCPTSFLEGWTPVFGKDEPFLRNIHPHFKYQFRHSRKQSDERHKSFFLLLVILIVIAASSSSFWLCFFFFSLCTRSIFLFQI
jgi:hypothetical protein